MVLSEINLAHLSQCSDLNDAVFLIYKSLDRIFEICVPKKKYTNHKYPTWFNGGIIKNSNRNYMLGKVISRLNREMIMKYLNIYGPTLNTKCFTATNPV